MIKWFLSRLRRKKVEVRQRKLKIDARRAMDEAAVRKIIKSAILKAAPHIAAAAIASQSQTNTRRPKLRG